MKNFQYRPRIIQNPPYLSFFRLQRWQAGTRLLKSFTPDLGRSGLENQFFCAISTDMIWSTCILSFAIYATVVPFGIWRPMSHKFCSVVAGTLIFGVRYHHNLFAFLLLYHQCALWSILKHRTAPIGYFCNNACSLLQSYYYTSIR